MKTTLYSILAAAACGMAFGQTAYTNPVGYTTQALPANITTLVGLNVLTPTLASGTLTNVSGATLTDTAVDFTTTLVYAIPPSLTPTPIQMAVLEITSGTAAGTVQEFITYSGNTITLPSAITGIAIGDKYSIRRAPFLQEIFPANTGVVASAIGATGADVIWVPTGTGTYTKYWWKNGSPPVLHTTTTGTNDFSTVSSNIPLVYVDGILVQKKAAVGSLVLSGEVKKTNSRNLIVGLYPVSVTPSAGLTLFTAGLNIASAIGATGADIVWVPNGTGAFTKYWLKNGAPAVWHTTVNGTTDSGLAVDTNLPACIYVQRKTGSLLLNLAVPSSYSSF